VIRSDRSAGRKPHVLILGGGYVAITLAPQLRDAIKAGELTATVVSRTNFQMFHGFTGEMLTGRLGPGHTLNAARRVFRPAGVHVGEIESVDLENKVVTTSRHLDGARFELPYDHAVLALGTADNFTAYPGLAEHSFKLKTFDDCFRLRNHIVTMLELADIEDDPEERRRLLTFFIAGAGFAGSEIAGELSDWLRKLTSSEYQGIQPGECRVVLVHPGRTILPELSADPRHRGLIDFAARHLRKLGVEIMTGTRVAATTPNEVYLDNGDHVPTRTIVAAIGAKPPALFDTMEIPRERGRVRTDDYLRVDGYEDVWAAGDCAAIPDGDGGWCPPVGVYALKEGISAGENILRAVRGQSLEPFRYSGLGQAGSLGRRTAVGEFKGVQLKGLAAWMLWRGRLLYYVPTWDRRLRMVADWLLAPIVGRDIVEMSTADAHDYEVRHNVFQPGETVADYRRAARYVHIIVEGDVDIVGADDEHVIRCMHAGDHFDQKRLDRFEAERAIARSVVRTVSLRADQADQLRDVLGSAGRLVAWSGEMPAIDPNLQAPPS
jgi:NADH dehydrogenase